jgi:release factor glutamine methyltransferase
MDIDGPALDLTLKNAIKHGININCLLEDILTLDRLPGKYDIIVSNPPYVTYLEQSYMKANVLDHEPHLALFVPDKDPLRFYKKIITLAKKHLKPKGKLYFEINEKFGNRMISLCETHQCSRVRLLQDLNGNDRIIMTMFD